MPLFQRSVLDNYLKQLDAVRVALPHALLAQQDKTDKTIDALVYEHYGLMAEEIAVEETK